MGACPGRSSDNLIYNCVEGIGSRRLIVSPLGDVPQAHASPLWNLSDLTLGVGRTVPAVAVSGSAFPVKFRYNSRTRLWTVHKS